MAELGLLRMTTQLLSTIIYEQIMSFYRYYALLLCVGLFGLSDQQISQAQSGKAAAAPASAAQSTAAVKVLPLVPTNAFFSLNIRLQQIAQDPALAFLPWEVISGATIDAMGVDALKIERLDLIGNWTADNELGMALIITTKEKVSLDQLKPECFTGKAISGDKGRSYRLLDGFPIRRTSVCALSDTQFAMGNVPLVENVLTSQSGASELSQQMVRFGESSHVTLIVTPKPIREAVREALQSAPNEIRDDLVTLSDKVQVFAAKSQVSSSVSIPVLVETASDNDAQSVEDCWNRTVKYTVAQWRRGLAQSTFQLGFANNDNPFLTYGARAGKEITKQLTPTRKDSRLLLKLDDSSIHLVRGISTATNLVPALAGLRIPLRRDGEPESSPQPASSSGGAAAFKSNAEKSLAAIMLAVHNFESEYKAFPSTGIENFEKGTQLSWRVSLLPYLGQQKLYDKFKLDEPWDSQNNIKLLQEMPDVYRYSRSKAKPGYTVFHRPTGPGLASEVGMKMKMANFTDGTSNSIYLAISSDEAAVPWTKPDDFNPLENRELLRDEGGSYLFCMTSAQAIKVPTDTSPENLKALLTRGAGDIAKW